MARAVGCAKGALAVSQRWTGTWFDWVATSPDFVRHSEATAGPPCPARGAIHAQEGRSSGEDLPDADTITFPFDPYLGYRAVHRHAGG